MKIINFTTLYLLPIISIIYGLFAIFKCPKKINGYYGYRTIKSMKNEKTWRIAHLVSGAGALFIGIIMLIFVFIFRQNISSYNEIGLLNNGILIMTIEVVCYLLFTIVPTEIILALKFDQDGNKK